MFQFVPTFPSLSPCALCLGSVLYFPHTPVSSHAHFTPQGIPWRLKSVSPVDSQDFLLVLLVPFFFSWYLIFFYWCYILSDFFEKDVI